MLWDEFAFGNTERFGKCWFHTCRLGAGSGGCVVGNTSSLATYGTAGTVVSPPICVTTLFSEFCVTRLFFLDNLYHLSGSLSKSLLTKIVDCLDFCNASIQVASTPTKVTPTCIYPFQVVGACLKMSRNVLNSKTFKTCEMQPANPKRSRRCQKAHRMHNNERNQTVQKVHHTLQKNWIFWLRTVKRKTPSSSGGARCHETHPASPVRSKFNTT